MVRLVGGRTQQDSVTSTDIRCIVRREAETKERGFDDYSDPVHRTFGLSCCGMVR